MVVRVSAMAKLPDWQVTVEPVQACGHGTGGTESSLTNGRFSGAGGRAADRKGPRKTGFRSGVVRNHAQTVWSVRRRAVRHPDAEKEVQCYADI
jgi:hypothetical protein